MGILRPVDSKKTFTVIVNPDGTLRNPSLDLESRSMGLNVEAKNWKELLDSATILREEHRTALSEVYAHATNEQMEYDIDITNDDKLSHLHFILKPTKGGTYFSVIDDTPRTLAKREAENTARERALVAKLMRHDVRPPLVQAGGFANNSLRLISEYQEALRQGKNPNAQELIARLFRNLEITDAAVQDIEEIMLNLTKLGAVNKSSMDMYTEALYPALESARRYVRDTHKSIDFDGALSMKPGEARLRADPFRCQVIYRNLLNNPVKYMKGTSRICCGLEDRGNTFRFNVYNQGPVISESIIERIFEEGVTGDEHAGSGLGLFVVKTYIEEQGGKVWAERNRREGANIIFELPKE